MAITIFHPESSIIQLWFVLNLLRPDINFCCFIRKLYFLTSRVSVVLISRNYIKTYLSLLWASVFVLILWLSRSINSDPWLEFLVVIFQLLASILPCHLTAVPGSSCNFGPQWECPCTPLALWVTRFSASLCPEKLLSERMNRLLKQWLSCCSWSLVILPCYRLSALDVGEKLCSFCTWGGWEAALSCSL